MDADLLTAGTIVASAVVWLVGLEWRVKNLTNLVDVQISNLQKTVERIDQRVSKLTDHLIDD